MELLNSSVKSFTEQLACKNTVSLLYDRYGRGTDVLR